MSEFKELADAVLDYANGTEAAAVKLRMEINKILASQKPSVKLPFDAAKIKWQDNENENGPFQVSSDYDCLDHKELLKFLAAASGFVVSDGFKYWTYQDGARIGRRPIKKEGQK